MSSQLSSFYTENEMRARTNRSDDKLCRVEKHTTRETLKNKNI